MRISVSTLIIVLVLAIATRTFAQSTCPPNKTLLDSIKPSLVAISVADLDQTVKWYQDNLEFVVKEQKDFPQYNLRIAFLELNGFELELVEDKNSVALTAIQKYIPEADDQTKIQGLVKLAFTVADIETLAARLKSKGVRFQIELTKSNRKETDKFFIIRDNCGNWIQFLGKSK
ncbi:MAG: VOC family protein [Acidobacteriota bacterium]